MIDHESQVVNSSSRTAEGDQETGGWGYALSNTLHGLGVYVVLPMLTLLVTVDVALRYLFNTPLTGANEIAGVMLLLILVFSLPLATAKNRHIRVDLVYGRFGPRLQRMAELSSSLAGAFVTSCLAWHSLRAVPNEIRFNEATLLLQIPHWPLSLIVGIVALLLAFLFILKAGFVISGGKDR